MKNSFHLLRSIFAVRRRRQRVGRRPIRNSTLGGFEALESRQMLTTVTGVVGSDEAAVTLTVADNSVPVVLGIMVEAADGSALDPQAPRVVDTDEIAVAVVQSTDSHNGTSSGYATVQVEAGDYKIYVGGESDTAGAFVLDVTMLGDLGQDGGVGQDELQWTAAAMLQQQGWGNHFSSRMFRSMGIDPTIDLYRTQLDANQDGIIGGTDVVQVTENSQAGSVTVGLVAVDDRNDPPERTGGTLTAIDVNEDHANSTAVTLGLSGVTYGPGGGAEEATQTLTYTITGIPSPVQIFQADAATQVNVNDTVTATELQGLTYMTVANANGSEDLTWTVTDSGDGTAPNVNTLDESLTITVNAVNDAPERTDGTLTAIVVAEDSANGTAVSLGLSDVTYGPGGGSDESAQTLTYTITAIPSHVQIFKSDGTTQVNVTDTVTATELQGLTYKTVANASGSGALTWTVTDSGDDAAPNVNTLDETLTITVNAVNDAPERTGGTLTPIDVDEDSANGTAVSLGLGGVTYGPGGGSDESAQTLTYTITGIPSYVQVFQADGTTPVNETDTITAAELQGLTYKTVANASGSAALTWTVTDSGDGTAPDVNTLGESLTITVNAVNDLPAVTDVTKSVNEDLPLTFAAADFTAVFSDADTGDALQKIKITSLPGNGTLQLSGSNVVADQEIATADLGNLTYQGNLHFSGGDSFAWDGSDGTDYSGTPATVDLTVNAVNDAPERTAGTLTPIDVNEDSANGTAVSLGLGGVTYVPGGGSDESAQTLTYTITAIPSYVQIFQADGTTPVNETDTVTATELQGLTYKTVANASGSGALTWTVADSGDGTAPNVNTLGESLTITVNAVNDAPAVTDVTKSVNEDVALTFAAADFTAVFSDADTGDALQKIKITSLPGSGTLQLSGSNVVADQEIATADLGNLTYQGNLHFSGGDSFTWDGSDGTVYSGTPATVNLTVMAVNDAPERTAGTLTPIDVDEDSANGTAVSLGLGGVTYVPGGGSDESAQTLTYTITGIPSYVHIFQADGTTPVNETDTITATELQGLTYKTVANASGSGALTWTVTDSGDGTAPDVNTLGESLTITVNAVNDLPAVTDVTKSVNEDVPLTFAAADFTAVFSDVDTGDALQEIKITSLPGNGTLQLSGSNVVADQEIAAADLGNLTYQGNLHFNGGDSFTWDGSDGTDYSGTPAMVNLTVMAVNDAPERTAGTLTPIDVDEDSANGTAVSLGLGGVTYGPGGGSDESAQTLTYTITGIPSYVQIFEADGATPVNETDTVTATELQGLTYKTVANASGSGALTWTVTDSGDGTAPDVNTLGETLTITVNSVNDVPAVTDVAKSGNEDLPLTFSAADFTAVFSDADTGDALQKIKITSLPGDGTLQLSGSNVVADQEIATADLGNLTYTGDLHFTGGDSFAWDGSDGTDYSGTPAMVNLTVNAVNNPPERTAGTLTPIDVDEESANGTAVSLGLSGVTYGPGGGPDESAQTLSYTITGIPSYVQIFKADGTTQVNVNDPVTATELQGLMYKTVANESGSGALTWTVTDSGDGTAPNVNTLGESLTITVNAINDAPVRTGTLTAIVVDEDSANDTAVSLGLSGVTYGPGGGSDESAQTLTYTITGIPLYVQIFQSDGTTQVNVDDTVTATELQGLMYKTVADANGNGNLTWTVTDSGSGAAPNVSSLDENLSITVNAVEDDPTFANIEDVTLKKGSASDPLDEIGSPLHIPLDGFDADGQALTYDVVSSNPDVTWTLPETVSRNMRIVVEGFGANPGEDGVMVFRLFEQRVPDITARIVDVVNAGSYDDTTFDTVINGFKIQAGIVADPLNWPEIDDQFHQDIQHNRTGLLSMETPDDDQNTTRFFVTEISPGDATSESNSRFQDFNNSVFGILVEGEDVRERISNVATTGVAPQTPVVIKSVEIVTDIQNNVLMLKANNNASGTSDITVTVTDSQLNEYSQTFQVSIEADTFNSTPFLQPIPEIHTTQDTFVEFTLSAIDVENNTNFFAGANVTDGAVVSVDEVTGVVTATPPPGATGSFDIIVGVADTNFNADTVDGDGLDAQIVTIIID